MCVIKLNVESAKPVLFWYEHTEVVRARAPQWVTSGEEPSERNGGRRSPRGEALWKQESEKNAQLLEEASEGSGKPKYPQ